MVLRAPILSLAVMLRSDCVTCGERGAGSMRVLRPAADLLHAVLRAHIVCTGVPLIACGPVSKSAGRRRSRRAIRDS